MEFVVGIPDLSTRGRPMWLRPCPEVPWLIESSSLAAVTMRLWSEACKVLTGSLVRSLMERRFTGGIGPAPPPPDAVPQEEITASQRSQLQQEMLMKSEAVLSALPSSWMSARQLRSLPTV